MRCSIDVSFRGVQRARLNVYIDGSYGQYLLKTLRTTAFAALWLSARSHYGWFIRHGSWTAIAADCVSSLLGVLGNIGRRPGALLNLLHKPHHVPVLPHFRGAAIRNSDDRYSRDMNGFPGWRHAQPVPCVIGAARPADAYTIMLGD